MFGGGSASGSESSLRYVAGFWAVSVLLVALFVRLDLRVADRDAFAQRAMLTYGPSSAFVHIPLLFAIDDAAATAASTSVQPSSTAQQQQQQQSAGVESVLAEEALHFAESVALSASAYSGARVLLSITVLEREESGGSSSSGGSSGVRDALVARLAQRAAALNEHEAALRGGVSVHVFRSSVRGVRSLGALLSLMHAPAGAGGMARREEARRALLDAQPSLEQLVDEIDELSLGLATDVVLVDWRRVRLTASDGVVRLALAGAALSQELAAAGETAGSSVGVTAVLEDNAASELGACPRVICVSSGALPFDVLSAPSTSASAAALCKHHSAHSTLRVVHDVMAVEVRELRA